MATVLHVAALPFPSVQGTQALLHRMLLAHQAAGHAAHLLCYAHGDGRALPYPVHRVGDWPRARSLRSGPSWHKPLLDVRLAAYLVRLHRRLAPDLVIAHHVEAAACAAAVLRGDWVFYAHTALSGELPTYFDALLSAPLSRAGDVLDRWLVQRAPHVCAVSPWLASHLAQRTGRVVEAPAVPWPVAPATTRHTRQQARQALSLGFDDEVVLYAGNLDAYQGLDVWLEALRTLCLRRPRLLWLLATASDTSPLKARLSREGLAGRVVIVPLDERTRPDVHAAADLAVVPRLLSGGVPVKLLEAMAWGLPMVAVESATGGLPIADLAWLVPAEAPALADAVGDAMDSPVERSRRGKVSRAYVGLRHSAEGWARYAALDPSRARGRAPAPQAALLP